LHKGCFLDCTQLILRCWVYLRARRAGVWLCGGEHKPAAQENEHKLAAGDPSLLTTSNQARILENCLGRLPDLVVAAGVSAITTPRAAHYTLIVDGFNDNRIFRCSIRSDRLLRNQIQYDWLEETVGTLKPQFKHRDSPAGPKCCMCHHWNLACKVLLARSAPPPPSAVPVHNTPAYASLQRAVGGAKEGR